MKSLYLSLVLCLGFIFPSLAQSLKSTQHTVLWAVVTPKGDTSYLFGVFHDIGDSYLDKYPVTKAALRKTGAVMLEGITETNPKKNGYTKAQDAANKDWYKTLSQADFQLLDDYMIKVQKGVSAQADSVGMKDMAEAGASPQELYVLFLHLAIYDVCHIHFIQDEQAIEDYLTYWTMYHNKKRMPLIGLETAEELDTTFDVAPHFVDSLRSIVQHPEAYVNDCALADDYKNLNGFDYAFSQSSVAADSSNQALLHDRNAKWLPKIEAQLKKSKTFIAVGLMHLWYSDGLISLLTADGYKVFPIAMK